MHFGGFAQQQLCWCERLLAAFRGWLGSLRSALVGASPVTAPTTRPSDFDGAGFTRQSWYVGLQWDDAFIKGNALGMAVGQPTFVTSFGTDNDLCGATPNDGNYAWEWWYKFQVTDNISVTPALYYLARPPGQLGKGNWCNRSSDPQQLRWPHQDHLQVLIYLNSEELTSSHIFELFIFSHTLILVSAPALAGAFLLR